MWKNILMPIRKAGKTDLPQIVALAAEHNLDYEGREMDDFRVAEESDKIVGICGLKRHPDCWELCLLFPKQEFIKNSWSDSSSR